MNNLTVEIARDLNSTELRKAASTLGVKNYTQYKKADLLNIVEKLLTPPPTPTVLSKSALLRGLIDELGANVTSGKLMFLMRDRYDIEMHRSFVITVKNKYLAA